MVPTSALSAANIAEIRRRIGEHPIFRLYFETALRALNAGEDNRRFMLSEAGGLIQSIQFDTLLVMTVTSPVTDEEIGLLTTEQAAIELHLDAAVSPVVRRVAASRITADQELRYYVLPADSPLAAGPRCLRLGQSDLAEVRDFARRHNPKSVFSDWMIDLAMFGLRAGGALEAIGGVIARDAETSTCMLGNFITAPQARGKGHAQALCRMLVHTLRQEGFRTIALCTTADNVAACRAYEAVGFQCVETRTQLDLSAADSRVEQP